MDRIPIKFTKITYGFTRNPPKKINLPKQVNHPDQFPKPKKTFPLKNPSLPFNSNLSFELSQKVLRENFDYIQKPNYQNVLTIENGFFHPDPFIATIKIFHPN